MGTFCKFNMMYLRSASFAILLLSTISLRAQDSLYIKEHYQKYEYYISMRDGVRLFTSVFVPRDMSQKYPIILNRTPYSVSPYGASATRNSMVPSMSAAREGYIFAYQDVRGRFMSEGEFINVRPYKPVKKDKSDIDETTDTYDTVDWLVKNVPDNNGRVGITGISYPGFYSTMGTIDAHPAVKATSPQAPIADWFIGDDFHHHGALFLPHQFWKAATDTDSALGSVLQTRHAGWLQVLSQYGFTCQREQDVYEGQRFVLERNDAAQHVRRILADTQHPPSPEEYPACGDDRRWMVRRGGSLRCVEYVPRD
jgi:predicted acyl esterase